MDFTARDMSTYSRGFDRGNYANAYETSDFDAASEKLQDFPEEGVYRDAFIIGFYSSYENEEVSEDHLNALLNATARRYELAKAAGAHCPYRRVIPGQPNEDE